MARFDGQFVHQEASYGTNPEGLKELEKMFPCTLEHNSAVIEAIVTSKIVHLPDVLDIADYHLAKAAEVNNARRMLAVPLLRNKRAIGAIVVSHREPGYFLDHQVALIQTFAVEAVIAIENVRRFLLRWSPDDPNLNHIWAQPPNEG